MSDQTHQLVLTVPRTMSKAYSWASFNISQEMLREIIAHHNVTPEFLTVVFSFRRHTNRLEEAFSDRVWVSDSKDTTGKFHIITST
jgi:hypothetical protein